MLRGSTMAVLLAVAYVTGRGAEGAPHDPNRTATVFVPGFRLNGPGDDGVYGADDHDAVLDELAEFYALPTINQPAGESAPNVVAGTSFYGAEPPEYYTAGDVAEVAAVTAQWGGGVPRYALIVAKYAEHVMERSGAAQVNFASASMGSLVVRWLIEKDVEGLASAGKIARWLSLEGILAGNWAASRDELAGVWDAIGAPAIDLSHMRYEWVESNLAAPRRVADNPLLAPILIGQTVSTEDSAIEGALTAAMFVYGEFQPNDSVQGLFDALFAEVTPRSRFLNRPPATAFHHVDHFALEDHRPALAQAATFLTQRRRVTITLIRAQVTNIHEPALPFFDFTPAEIVFESRVRSPRAAARWAVAGSHSTRGRSGVSSPIVPVGFDGAEVFPQQLVFDDFVLDEETQLTVELGGHELDWDVEYGVFEPLADDGQPLAGAVVTVPIATGGVHQFAAGDWNGTLLAEVFEYPFPALGVLGDATGDGVVNMADLLRVLEDWGPCPAPPAVCPADVVDDGAVDAEDMIIVLGHWS
jgi:hypothetical protein